LERVISTNPEAGNRSRESAGPVAAPILTISGDDSTQYLGGAEGRIRAQATIPLRDPVVARAMHQAVGDQLVLSGKDNDVADPWFGGH
jgi:hypothetical protein